MFLPVVKRRVRRPNIEKEFQRKMEETPRSFDQMQSVLTYQQTLCKLNDGVVEVPPKGTNASKKLPVDFSSGIRNLQAEFDDAGMFVLHKFLI